MNFAVADLTASRQYAIEYEDALYNIIDESELFCPVVAWADNKEIADIVLDFLNSLPLGAKFPAMHEWEPSNELEEGYASKSN